MHSSSIIALSLDLGTTAIKGGLLDESGVLRQVFSLPAPKMGGDAGSYESDALAYAALAEQVLAQISGQAGDVPLGLCSQRSSFVIWERASGRPVTPLVSWQDTRGAASCHGLKAREARIVELSGLRLTPYYLGPKLHGLLQQQPSLRAGLELGALCAGTLDSFLLWRWTGGRHFVTDASMAARTQLMDIHRLDWSAELCELFEVSAAWLPQIVPSTGLDIRLGNGLLLAASMGDQSAALFASVGADDRVALVNLGTGGFVLHPTLPGRTALPGYLNTLLYLDARRRPHLAEEGTLNSLAAALAPYPFRERSLADLARNDLFSLSEPSGLGAPYFRDGLGVTFSGPVERLLPEEIAALLLEGVVFRVARILEEFHQATPLELVCLSGGLSEVAALRQGIAQCAPCPVNWLTQKESSLLGAALLAAGRETAAASGERLAADAAGEALRAKYRRWKRWLDGLLAA